MLQILVMLPEEHKAIAMFRRGWERQHVSLQWCSTYEEAAGALKEQYFGLVALSAPAVDAEEREFLSLLRSAVVGEPSLVVVWAEQVEESQLDAWAQVGISEVLNGSASVTELNVRLRWLLARALHRLRSLEEKAGWKSEAERMPPLMEQAQDGIFISDVDGRYLDVNPAACSMLNYSREELLQKHISDVMHPADMKRTPLHVSVLKGGHSVRTERRLLRKDGSLVVAELSLNTLSDGRLVAFARDISKRRYAEEALRRERDRAQSYLDLAGVMFIALDSKGIVTLANAKACNVLGYPEAEILNKDWFTHFLPENIRENTRSAFETVMRLGRLGTAEHYENVVMTQKGEERTISWHNVLLRDASGGVMGMLSSGEDLTDRRLAAKQAEQAELARAAAEAANKAKTEFLAMMSHEIRTPMNAVVGVTSLLLESGALGGQYEYLDTLQGAAQSLQSLLNDILDFSKIDAGKLEIESMSFSLRQLIEDVFDLFAERVRTKGLKLALSMESGLHDQVRGDVGRLRQILTNLLANAIKFTEAGEILVTVERLQHTDGLEHVQFEVHDTGIGIAPEQVATIFDPFYQAHRTASQPTMGTGLGLAITQRLVTLMGGSIDVESELGQGSRFRFHVFLENDGLSLESATPTELPKEAVKVKTSQKKKIPTQSLGCVLVVEDNPVNQKVACWMLQRLGYEADVAEHGKIALQHLQKKSYDAILMDCQMPVMDGYETSRQIRATESETTSHTPIIAMTAEALRGQRERCLSAGMDDYLPKPVNLETLQEILQHWISASP